MADNTRQFIGIALMSLGIAEVLPEPGAGIFKAIGILLGLLLIFGDFKT